MEKVTFKKDQVLSYDGIHTKEYKANQTYSAQHPHEARVFQSLADAGVAEAVVDSPTVGEAEEKPAPKTVKKTAKKVATPKAKK